LTLEKNTISNCFNYIQKYLPTREQTLTNLNFENMELRQFVLAPDLFGKLEKNVIALFFLVNHSQVKLEEQNNFIAYKKSYLVKLDFCSK